ncbi:hypothetical protein AAL_05563 [Moelleriella libera RCEF 2490]|uniref:Uncharacterized protein n=1 Tax=Moelleriella libera RCEF 2490 TaxID=1081109 RepID=A0A168AEZ2_9HYPO|nr:hypothetical protein AAL_05563 [Moelleriella libera RCEF 2490]
MKLSVLVAAVATAFIAAADACRCTTFEGPNQAATMDCCQRAGGTPSGDRYEPLFLQPSRSVLLVVGSGHCGGVKLDETGCQGQEHTLRSSRVPVPDVAVAHALGHPR